MVFLNKRLFSPFGNDDFLKGQYLASNIYFSSITDNGIYALF